mgnify:CR=1 FL=1
MLAVCQVYQIGPHMRYPLFEGARWGDVGGVVTRAGCGVAVYVGHFWEDRGREAT